MSTQLTDITYGSVASPPPSQHVAVSSLAFDATVARLKRAIQEEDLWLIHEVDPQMLLKRGGYTIHATRQLLFFHPRYMARLLTLDPNALMEAPLKLVVMALPDGTVTVRFSSPEALFGRYDGFADLIDELATLCHRMVHTVAPPEHER